MGWVMARPSLVAIELAWRWIFGIPFLAVCWIEAQRILTVLPESAGLNRDRCAKPLGRSGADCSAWGLYEPHITAICTGLRL
jgi:hypothetical protein